MRRVVQVVVDQLASWSKIRVDAFGCDDCGNTAFQSAKFLRRNSAIGVFRTGPDPRDLSPPLVAARTGDGAGGVSRAQTTSPRQTQRVEPRGIVFDESRRKEFAFPGGGRRFEAFELIDDGANTFRSFHLVLRSNLLPREQEADEVGEETGSISWRRRFSV